MTLRDDLQDLVGDTPGPVKTAVNYVVDNTKEFARRGMSSARIDVSEMRLTVPQMANVITRLTGPKRLLTVVQNGDVLDVSWD